MRNKPAKRPSSLDIHYDAFLGDISNVIEAARKSVARSVNRIITAAYRMIGRRIVRTEQGGQKRAAYGEELRRRLADDLGCRFGRGLGVDNLQRFRAFSLNSPPERIYATVSSKSNAAGRIGNYPKQSRITGENPSLADIACCLSLPWSAYV